MGDKCCVILAAGEGKRMKSDVPKVLSQVLFEPMLGWVVRAARKSGIDDICVVTGFKHEIVESYLDEMEIKCEYVVQGERKGTAHAVTTAGEFLKRHIDGDVLVLGGDSPFIDEETVGRAYKAHKEESNSATIISSRVKNPFGYGRIIRDARTDAVTAIVEESDASPEQKEICEINSGAYWFRVRELLDGLPRISNDVSQREYYLTSVIELLINDGFKVNAVEASISDLALGANDSCQLRTLNEIARKKVIDDAISKGVNIPCCDGVIIGRDVEVKGGTTILPGTVLMGKTFIGENCIIGPNSQVIDGKIGNGAIINSSYCKNGEVLSGVTVGPFESVINAGEKYLKRT